VTITASLFFFVTVKIIWYNDILWIITVSRIDFALSVNIFERDDPFKLSTYILYTFDKIFVITVFVPFMLSPVHQRFLRDYVICFHANAIKDILKTVCRLFNIISTSYNCQINTYFFRKIIWLLLVYFVLHFILKSFNFIFIIPFYLIFQIKSTWL